MIYNRTIKLDDVDIFYRDAGRQDAPVLLLLHGFPTSSRMFLDLIPKLAGKFRLIAPDYPGFGYSSMPDPSQFSYTFENLANIVDRFTQALDLKSYSLYVMDYGAPIGFRLALLHPERIEGLIVQNGNAYHEGLGDFWTPLKTYWEKPTEENRDALRVGLTPDTTEWQYTHGVPDRSAVNPDLWHQDQAGLKRPGNDRTQLDLFYDYRTNVALYSQFHEYFRKHQPKALIIWGKNDEIFLAEGAIPYGKDLPNAEIHLLNTGHFALATHADEIAQLILNRY